MAEFRTKGRATFRKRHPEVGARPGTLLSVENAPPAKVHVIQFDKKTVRETDITEFQQIAASLDSQSISWIDVQGFGDLDTIKKMGELFAIHPLALEDIVNVPQRPKAEAYGDQVLIIARMFSLNSDQQVEMEQVAIVLGNNYVLTFQERYGDIFDPVRERIRTGSGRIRQSNADYLAYVIIDTLVDGYYPVIDELGDHLERLEEMVMEHPSNESLRYLNQTKNLLVNMRRAVWPQREAVNSLIREENPLISDDVRVYLRDTYDHCVQSAEVIEMYREMATGLINIYLSSVANRSNDVMKVLTIMASIFIPLTFMAGIYGMNFEHMPELSFRWSYPLLWAAMVFTSGSMIFFFWRKGWFGTLG